MEKEPRNDFYFLIEFGKLCILDTEYLLEVERTPKYRTLNVNTSNIDTQNFEHFEHDAQISRPNFEQARPNIELLGKSGIKKSATKKAGPKKRDQKQDQKAGPKLEMNCRVYLGLVGG